MKVRLDVNAGIGLTPDSVDLAQLVDPFHAWATAEEALAANAGTEDELTSWLDADAADALGLLLIKKAIELRSLTAGSPRCSPTIRLLTVVR
jgi:hypothetical protein